MRIPPQIEKFRICSGSSLASNPVDPYGAFIIPGPFGRALRVIASPGNDKVAREPDEPLIAWEHVSVSLPNRCPSWPEMDFIKRLFWCDEETVVQLHPPRSRWINMHPYCLHLWRPTKTEIPLPPEIAVGLKDARGTENPVVSDMDRENEILVEDREHGND